MWVKFQMSGDRKNEKALDEKPPKLKLSDKVWVALVIILFIIAFVLILIFDAF